MTQPDLTPEDCRGRQQRVLQEMRRRDLEWVVVTQLEHVQYLAGPRFRPVYSPAAALSLDGRLTLVAPNEPPAWAAADEVTTYEAQWLSTLRNDQRMASAQALFKAAPELAKAQRVGVEFSCCGPHLSNGLNGEMLDIEPDLYRLRRVKDADELACLKKAIAGTKAMYARAREIIAPGVNELDVFNELQAVAVREFGEMLTGTGNDYASGVPGGPPRDRRAESGELYILDLGPAYRGYFADNCRAIAVNGKPTDVQKEACEHITKVFDIVRKMVKPGASCRALFTAAKAHLDELRPGSFSHHLGHGIGLFPHEAPHLNSEWDDAFQAGEVFTAEPGLYAADLRGGIRLEQDFLVTASGVELLSDFPLGL